MNIKNIISVLVAVMPCGIPLLLLYVLFRRLSMRWKSHHPAA